jgi:anti-anti-sigma regulatory factor
LAAGARSPRIAQELRGKPLRQDARHSPSDKPWSISDPPAGIYEVIMQKDLRHWLSATPLDDPLEQQQAGLLQVMLLIIIGACFIGMAIGFLNAPPTSGISMAFISYTIMIVCMLGGLYFLRSGRFRPAVGLAITAIIVAIAISVIPSGFPLSSGAALSFTVPVTMAGLLLGRRGLLLAGGAVVGIVVGGYLLQLAAPNLVGFMPGQPTSAGSSIPIFVLIIAVLSLFLDRFATTLRNALSATQAREQELERLRDSLETTVADRTASLQQALEAGEQRQAQLAQTLEDLRASEATIRELSAPVIPVLPGVLVAPLIGALDSARAAELTDNVLGMVEREHARQVIFDITGVPLVDTHVAKVLLQTTTAVRLLGAQALLVGIRPEVAQTIVALNIDMNALRTFSSLREAIAALLVAGGGQPVEAL